jgi:hypothetical protein
MEDRPDALNPKRRFRNQAVLDLVIRTGTDKLCALLGYEAGVVKDGDGTRGVQCYVKVHFHC